MGLSESDLPPLPLNLWLVGHHRGWILGEGINGLHAKDMRRIILSPVACPALPYFCTLSHKRHDFRVTAVVHKMCVLIFSTTFVRNISHYKKNSARYCHKCTPCPKKIVPFIYFFFFLGAQCVESGVSCTDCY